MDKLLQTRKKHFTAFLLGEVAFLSIAIAILTFLEKVSRITLGGEDNSEIIDEVSHLTLGTDGMRIWNFVPLGFVLAEIILVLAVIFIRDKKQNPILAKKWVKWVFYISCAILVIDIVLRVFFIASGYYNQQGNIMVTYSYRIPTIIIPVLQALITLDIYFWRSDFGLEKFYGQPDSVY